MRKKIAGDEWDAVAEAHDINAADHRNYVVAHHPVLPGVQRPEDAEFQHRDVGCDCIAARYSRAEYVRLFEN